VFLDSKQKGRGCGGQQSRGDISRGNVHQRPARNCRRNGVENRRPTATRGEVQETKGGVAAESVVLKYMQTISGGVDAAMLRHILSAEAAPRAIKPENVGGQIIFGEAGVPDKLCPFLGEFEGLLLCMSASDRSNILRTVN
jgi:hypothetical protein